MDDIGKTEFLFYSRLARRLVVNLSESSDRILAIAWIRKLLDENIGDESLRTTYLKLLLSCLQRRRLSGIFANDPLSYEVLEKLLPDMDETGMVEKRARREELALRRQESSQTAEIMEEADCSFYVFQEAGEMDYDLFDEAPSELVYPDIPQRTVSRPEEPSLRPPLEVTHALPSGSRRTCPSHGSTLPPSSRLQPVANPPSQSQEQEFFNPFRGRREPTISERIKQPQFPLQEEVRKKSHPHSTFLPSPHLQPGANPPSQNQEQEFFNPFRGRREAKVVEHTNQPQFLRQEETHRKYHHHSTFLPSSRLQSIANPPPQNQEQEFFNPFRGRIEATVPKQIKQPQFPLQEETHRKSHHHSTLISSPCLQPVVNPPSQNQEQEFFNPFRGRREATVSQHIKQPQVSLQEGTRRKCQHSTLLPSPCLQPVANPPSQTQEEEFFNPFRGRREATVPKQIKQPQFPLQEGTPRKYHHHPTLLPSPDLQSVANLPSQNQEQEFFNPFRGRREATALEHIEQPQFPLYEGTPKKYDRKSRRRIRAALQPRRLFMDESQVVPESVSPPEPYVVCNKEESFKKKKWNRKRGSWGPYETDEDEEYLAQAMQGGQGAMLGGTHIHQSPAMYELPESMSPQIREGCKLTQRLVDEMMLHMGNDQTADDEILKDSGSPCSPCRPCTPPKTQKQRRPDDQTLDEFIIRRRARPESATQAIPRQITAIEERTRARERLRDRNQQDPKEEERRCPVTRSTPVSASSSGSQSPSRIMEHAAVSSQKNTGRRSIKKTLSYKKTWH